MSSFLRRSTWLRLFAFVHVLSRASVCSFGPNACCLGTRTQQQLTGRAIWTPTRAALQRATSTRSRLSRRRPREGRTGLSMAPLYRDDAEAGFYAQQLQDLITAYALKTANHYWMELRGNMYSEWLTRYIAECGGIESVGWHAFLSGMLRAPPEDIVVKKLIKSPRGGSGNNPFLADRKPVTYTETIEPTTIARRLMDIREQMAEQLSADLRQMAAENYQLERDYIDESELGPDRAQALRMSVLEPMVDVDPSSGLSNPPQRRAAYRTAVELATAASMRRVKSELRIRGDSRTLDWLDRFSDRELDQRGNELIQSLFAGPMVYINDPSRARPNVIEPLKVAQDIMKEREVLAEEFIAVLEKVPQDHLRMTVSLLNEKWVSPGDAGGGEPDARES